MNLRQSKNIILKPKLKVAHFMILDGSYISIRKSLPACEWFRSSLLDFLKSKTSDIPWEVSGHNIPQDKQHEHFFYFPFDTLNRGVIDSFYIYCTKGFDPKIISYLKQFKTIKNEEKSWTVSFVNLGTAKDFSKESNIFSSSHVWLSSSPYLHPWHRKKNFNHFEQLQKECQIMGYPELEKIQIIPYLQKGERRIYPLSFKRFRSKKTILQPDKRGGFWQLIFKEEIQGPIALGFANHFGMGLFQAVPVSTLENNTQAILKRSL